MDTRQFAPATQRNREPILAVLTEVLPPTGTVLEISSGTGEHAIFFAPALAPRMWITSDPNPVARSSIAAWQAHSPQANLYGPLYLDTQAPLWPIEPGSIEPQATRENYREGVPPDLGLQDLDLQDLDLQVFPIQAIVNINMIHISPWSACEGLMAGATNSTPRWHFVSLWSLQTKW
jgi:hypothetical protein